MNEPGTTGRSGVVETPAQRTSTMSVTGAGQRLLLYSHDTFGLGHLRRCLKISDTLVRRFPELSVLLVTGSPVVHRYRLPPGVDYVKLPAVRKTGRERYEARSLGTPFDRILAMRTRLILETIREFAPHVLLVDHSPVGMRGEMRPALEWLKETGAHTETMLGLRDIIDDADRVKSLWHSDGTYDVLERLYDRILIYGTREIFDPTMAYGFSADLTAKSTFCHYVADHRGPTRPRSQEQRPDGERPVVLVTIGGGDGAADTVIEPYIEMLCAQRDALTFHSVIVTGPFVAADYVRALRLRVRHLPVTIRQHVAAMRPLLERSRLVIATAGYNTTTEILCHARSVIFIPRKLHRLEQSIRARRFADLGLGQCLSPEEATPDRLFAQVMAELQHNYEPLADARRAGRIPFDGAERIADGIESALARQAREPVTEREDL